MVNSMVSSVDPKQNNTQQNEAEGGHVTHVYGSNFHSEHDPAIHLGFSVLFLFSSPAKAANYNRVV